MDTLFLDTKPSTSNILKTFYTEVTRLSDYLNHTVSSTRFARINIASHENEELNKLLNTSLVCLNPKYITNEDDEEMERDVSILSMGGYATQSEVPP